MASPAVQLPVAVVSDSACLIGLERIGQLDLLPQLFTTIYVPPAVAAEFGQALPFLRVQPVQNAALVIALRLIVDPGESEAIALTQEIPGAILLLDDRKARQIAVQMGVSIVGTAGVLIQAKQRGLITAVKPSLDALQANGFRIGTALYREILRLAGE